MHDFRHGEGQTESKTEWPTGYERVRKGHALSPLTACDKQLD